MTTPTLPLDDAPLVCPDCGARYATDPARVMCARRGCFGRLTLAPVPPPAPTRCPAIQPGTNAACCIAVHGPDTPHAWDDGDAWPYNAPTPAEWAAATVPPTHAPGCDVGDCGGCV